MRIDDFLWLDEILDKISIKHNVEAWEVEEIFANSPRIRFRERGNRNSEIETAKMFIRHSVRQKLDDICLSFSSISQRIRREQ